MAGGGERTKTRNIVNTGLPLCYPKINETFLGPQQQERQSRRHNRIVSLEKESLKIPNNH